MDERTRIKVTLIMLMTAGLFFSFRQSAAEAAYNFTSTMTNAPTPVEFTMGDPASITFQITNSSTGGEVDQRIYQMRFRLDSTTGGTVFSNTTAAPAGWTRTAFSTTSITFRANTANDAIVCTIGGCPVGPSTSKTFTLNIVAGRYSSDVTHDLRDVRAYFQDSTFSWPPSRSDSTITRTSGTSVGLWTLKSLLMTLVPSTTAVPVGGTFTLTMTVTNRSTSNLTGITSNPKPPTRQYNHLNNPPTPVAVATISNPANLNLNAGATGTMVWTYTTTGSGPGTVRFQAYAGVGTRTSKLITSVPVSIGVISGSFSITPTCLFSGNVATFVLTVTNVTGGTVNNIVPTALTRGGTATIGAFTGPAPASIASLANNSAGTFTWTATVTGTVGSTYSVTGSATGNGGNTTGPVVSGTEDVGGYVINLDVTETNLSSTNQPLTWSITNQGCAPAQSVSISFPSGWVWGGGAEDGYALVTDTVGNLVESWVASGPTSGPVQFASPSAAGRIPLTEGGDFELVFSAVPTSGTSSTFTVTVTDENGVTSPPQSQVVDLNAFNFNSLNEADTESYREEFR